MDSIDLLRELLPAEIVDNFDIVKYEKTKEAFDIWFGEKKIQEEDDAVNEQSLPMDLANTIILKVTSSPRSQL